MRRLTFYRTIQIDGLSIFYRRGRSERRTDDPSSARASVVVAHVRAALCPAVGSLPYAEIHIVDGGHFAMDTVADHIAALVQGFLGSSLEEVVARRAG